MCMNAVLSLDQTDVCVHAVCTTRSMCKQTVNIIYQMEMIDELLVKIRYDSIFGMGKNDRENGSQKMVRLRDGLFFIRRISILVKSPDQTFRHFLLGRSGKVVKNEDEYRDKF